MRVQIPVYTDAWMKGDRYGFVKKMRKKRRNLPPRALLSADADGVYMAVYSVELDKSGKTINVIANDCTEV